MQNVEFMETVQPDHHTDESPPYHFFVELRMGLLVLGNFLREVAVVRKFHNDTQTVSLDKCVLVASDGWACD